jgi:trehalose/maltose transport system permease protein
VKEETFKRTIIFAAVAVTILFCLTPFGYMILTSFSRQADFLSPDTPWAGTLANYRAVMASESLHFTDFMRNSIIVSAASAVISVFFAALAAYAITRLSLPGKLSFMFLILALSMFPPVSLVGYLYKLMTALGWINTYPALILPYVAWTLPLSLWILVSYFSRIPRDLDRAGLIDGCSRMQILFRIIFPVAAPGIFATLLLAFIFAFNEFLFALMLTTDHAARTIPVGIALFEGLHGQIPWGEIMAAATMATVPVVALALIFQRRIIQGLTRGAVKE